MILLERILAHLGLILVGEKIHYFSAMITLKLDHKAHILALNDGAIASYKIIMLIENPLEEARLLLTILLFKSFKKSPGIIVLMQSLNSRQGLTTVALYNQEPINEIHKNQSRYKVGTKHTLNTNMDVILGLRITNVVGERIYRSSVSLFVKAQCKEIKL
jgi:hypothetical protein